MSEQESVCASLRSAVVGVRKWSVPVVGVVAVSGVRSVARFLEGGMYWGSGLLRFGSALISFVERFSTVECTEVEVVCVCRSVSLTSSSNQQAC